MRKIVAVILSLIMVLTLFTACSGANVNQSSTTVANNSATAAPETSKPIRIGLVMKSLANPFFITMADAAKAKADELGVELISLAPDKETEVEKQVQIVENLIIQKVDAICLVPCGSKELVPVIKKANDANIPVLIIDTRIDKATLEAANAHTETFIGSDNYLGGQIAADELANLLGADAKVAVLEGIAGHESSENRVGGFRDKVEEMGILKIVASQPANWEQELGYNVMQNMLQANPDISGVFAANDLMGLGAIKAIENAGKLDSIKVIGFDAQDEAIVAIKAGKMLGSIAQHPDSMGQIGIEKALAVIKGETIEAEIPVEVAMVSKDTLN